MKAVEGNGTSIGVQCTDGVVVALEKVLVSPLLMPGSNRRVFTIDEHLGMAVSGFGADGRKIANEARYAARSYRANWGSPSPTKALAERLGGLLHAYTCYGALRPFGSAFILAGYDEDEEKASLWMAGPDGVCLKYVVLPVSADVVEVVRCSRPALAAQATGLTRAHLAFDTHLLHLFKHPRHFTTLTSLHHICVRVLQVFRLRDRQKRAGCQDRDREQEAHAAHVRRQSQGHCKDFAPEPRRGAGAGIRTGDGLDLRGEWLEIPARAGGAVEGGRRAGAGGGARRGF